VCCTCPVAFQAKANRVQPLLTLQLPVVVAVIVTAQTNKQMHGWGFVTHL